MTIGKDEPAADSGFTPLRHARHDGEGRRLSIQPQPQGHPMALTAILEPQKMPDVRSSRKSGFAIAVAGHLLLLAAFMVRISPEQPPLPTSNAMSVSYVVVPGDPPPGSPEGDDAPKPARKADSKPAASAEKESPDGTAPSAEEAPPSDDPSPEKADEPSVPIPAEGDGSLALGARTLGDAQGLDPSLMASVGQAIATRVRTCWTPPTAAPAGIAVRIIAHFAPDGSLSAAPTVVSGEGAAQQVVTTPDVWQKDAADAVVRCSPISLPSFLYPYWRDVEIQIYSTRG